MNCDFFFEEVYSQTGLYSFPDAMMKKKEKKYSYNSPVF